jgi:Ca2+-transporting ATPase
MEENTMLQKPKAISTTFFNWKELSTSILQGIMITAGTIFIYQYAAKNGYNEALTRTMTFTVLIAANIFLTLINRSFYYSILTTLKYKNNMVLFIIFTTITIVSLLLYIKPLTNFFEFETLDSLQLLICILTGFVSVIWFEVVKFIKRTKRKQSSI